jgi:hypothetical protein
MDARPGDTIVVESEKATQPHRTGVIEEVLAGEHPRYRVQWEDGHTSVLAPEAGAARIQVQRRKRGAEGRSG